MKGCLTLIFKGFLVLIAIFVAYISYHMIKGPPSKMELAADGYYGTPINAEWNVRTTCQTAAYLFKKRYQFRSTQYECTVSKLGGKLPGRFSNYEPYMVQWSNGYAARVFVTHEGLRMSGMTTDYPPKPHTW